MNSIEQLQKIIKYKFNSFPEEKDLVYLNIYMTAIIDKAIEAFENNYDLDTNYLIQNAKIDHFEQIKILRERGFNYLSFCIDQDISYLNELIRVINHIYYKNIDNTKFWCASEETINNIYIRLFK